MTTIKDEIEEYFESKLLSSDIDRSDGSTMGYQKATKLHRLDEIKKSMMKLIDEVEKL